MIGRLGRRLLIVVIFAGLVWGIFSTGIWKSVYWRVFPRDRVIGVWRSSPEEKSRFPRILSHLVDELWHWAGDRHLEIRRDGSYLLVANTAMLETSLEGHWRWSADDGDVLVFEREGEPHRFSVTFEGDHRMVLEHGDTELYPPVMVYDRVLE